MNKFTYITVTAILSLASLATSAQQPTDQSQRSNPWDKYQAEPVRSKNQKANATPVVVEESPLDTDNLPAVTGSNPWDKYQPAPSLTPAKKKNVAKVKERPTNLELAAPLVEPEVPQGKRFLKNVLPVGTDNYFAIEYAGQLVGYSQFKITNLVTLAGQSTYVMESTSRIKLGINNVQDMKFTSNAQIDKKTLSPSMFLCVQGDPQVQKGNQLTVNCIYSKDFIAQNNNYAGNSQGYIEKFQPDNRPLLVFNNLWGHLDTFAEHYWLLVRAAAGGGTLRTYDPILQGSGSTLVYAPQKEKWQDHAGKNWHTLVYKITDINSQPLAYVRLNAKDYSLLEIREIGTGLIFRRSSVGVVKTLEKSSGQRIKSNAEMSNIYFQEPEKLNRLEAFVDLHLRGGQLAQHELNNYKQQFFGELKEGHMNGRVVVNSSLMNKEPKVKFPFNEEVPEDLQKYLAASPGVELEVGAIRTKALELSWKSETTYQAIKRLTGYISNQISEGVSLPSARQTLEGQVGNPESKALLLTAFLRSLKIPARTVGGLVYRDGSFLTHYWVEAWLGKEDGWIQFDPTLNESGFINASHVTLWESGDLQALDLVVEKFLPKPPRKVDYFNTPLKWSIGEEREYSIYQDDKLIGLESSHMYDMELTPTGENYKLKSRSVVLKEDLPLFFEGLLTINANGLPVAFHSSEDNGQILSSADFTFKGSNIKQKIDNKTEKSKYIPLPEESSESEESAEVAEDIEPAAPSLEEVTDSDKVENVTQEESSEQVTEDEDSSEETPPAEVVQEDPQVKRAAEIEVTRKKLQMYMDNYDKPVEGEVSEKPSTDVQDATEEKSRDIPYSFGTYMVDQRFLSQFALVIEQSPVVKAEETQKEEGEKGENSELIDPNTGKISVSEEILPQSDSATKDAKEVKEPSKGETGAGTFNKSSDFDEDNGEVYTINVFIPGTLKTQELTLQRAESDETVTMPNGEEIEAARLDTEKGMIFYVDLKTGKVIKISVPAQNLEMFLDKSEFRL